MQIMADINHPLVALHCCSEGFFCLMQEKEKKKNRPKKEMFTSEIIESFCNKIKIKIK